MWNLNASARLEVDFLNFEDNHVIFLVENLKNIKCVFNS